MGRGDSPVGMPGDTGGGLVPVGLQEGRVKLWVICSSCVVPAVSQWRWVAQCLVTSKHQSLVSQGESGGSGPGEGCE